MVTIIDYGMGNHLSVSNALTRLGYDAEVTSNADKIRCAQRIILPGVGSFYQAMKNIRSLNIDNAILESAKTGKPILGICLGMQLLGSSSQEGGDTEGLNLISNPVIKLDGKNQFRVPHVGFDNIFWDKDNVLTSELKKNCDVYFTHSYAMQSRDSEANYIFCDYSEKFVAAFVKKNIFGTQFHPEKSQRTGLQILKNFMEVEHA